MDQAYERTRSGDPEGFADWVRRVELPLRSSLQSSAAAATLVRASAASVLTGVTVSGTAIHDVVHLPPPQKGGWGVFNSHNWGLLDSY